MIIDFGQYSFVTWTTGLVERVQKAKIVRSKKMTHKELIASMDKSIEKMNDLRACCKSVRRQLKKRGKRQ